MEINIRHLTNFVITPPPIRRSQEKKFSPIVGNDITEIMLDVFITTINSFSKVLYYNYTLGCDNKYKTDYKKSIFYVNLEVYRISN